MLFVWARRKPIFDGICSQCGTLLHGIIGNCSALSNKMVGPPIDRDGNLLLTEDGAAKVDAQPPFLLRFSPALFAKEAPAMFKHDPLTNRLSLLSSRDTITVVPSRSTPASIFCLRAKWSTLEDGHTGCYRHPL